VSENEEKFFRQIEKLGIMKHKIISKALDVLAKEQNPNLRSYVGAFSWGETSTSDVSILASEPIENIDKNKLAKDLEGITVSFKKNLGIEISYDLSRKSFGSDNELVVRRKKEGKINDAEAIKILLSKRPEVANKAFKLVQKSELEKAIDSYNNFGSEEYVGPGTLYDIIKCGLKANTLEFKDLDPQSRKSNGEIESELKQKFDNYYIAAASHYFDRLKNDWWTGNNDKPNTSLRLTLETLSDGLDKERGLFDKFDGELDFSVLDLEGKKSSDEMAQEVDKAIAIWDARTNYSTYFLMYYNRSIETLNATKQKLEDLTKFAGVGYEIFDREGKKGHDEMKEVVRKKFDEFEKGLIKNVKEKIHENFTALKENETSNPDDFIKKIKEDLPRIGLSLKELGSEFEEEIHHYKRLSQARIAYNAILSNVEGLDKKGSFKFIKDTLKELDEDFKSLDPKSVWSAKEVEKELTKKVYANPAIEGPNTKDK